MERFGFGLMMDFVRGGGLYVSVKGRRIGGYNEIYEEERRFMEEEILAL